MFDTDFIKTALKIDAMEISGNTPQKFNGFSIDTRTIKADDCFIGIEGNNFDGNLFAPEAHKKGARIFILNKSKVNKVKGKIPSGIIYAVKDTVSALASLASKYKSKIFASVLAITGSSGKTTTRKLITEILSHKFNIHTAKKNLNNEIGLPLTILEAPLNTHIMVLELGMNHSGEISRLSRICRPLTSVITNIGYAHIGMLGSLNAIADAKSEIYDGMDNRGFAFLNRNDPYFKYLSKKSPVEVLDFGIEDIEVIEDKGLDGYVLTYNGNIFDYPLAGEHNLENLACAMRVANFYRIDNKHILKAAKKFPSLSGRSNVIKKEYTIIDDCYNANPSSMKVALKLLSKANGRKIAIVSDMLELGNFASDLHKEIGEFILSNKCADIVLGYGQYTKKLIEKAQSLGVKSEWVSSLDELIDLAKNTAKPGDNILVKASRGMQLDKVVDGLK